VKRAAAGYIFVPGDLAAVEGLLRAFRASFRLGDGRKGWCWTEYVF